MQKGGHLTKVSTFFFAPYSFKKVALEINLLNTIENLCSVT